jgi:putative tricarboxylic transport membrane protein
MRGRDMLSGAFWLVVAIFAGIEAARVGVGSISRPGPGFLPFCSVLVIGGFGAMLTLTSYLRKTVTEKKAPLWKGLRWKQVVLVLVTLSAYAILLPRIGYLIATFLLMMVLFGIIERPRLWVQFVTALVTVLATYVVFYVWLEIQLPKGLLDF